MPGVLGNRERVVTCRRERFGTWRVPASGFDLMPIMIGDQHVSSASRGDAPVRRMRDPHFAGASSPSRAADARWRARASSSAIRAGDFWLNGSSRWVTKKVKHAKPQAIRNGIW